MSESKTISKEKTVLDVILKRIKEIYDKYELNSEEELLVTTFGEYEEDAKADIMRNYPPERAAELLQASNEFEALIEKIVESARNRTAIKEAAMSSPGYLEDIARKAASYVYPNDVISNSLQIITIGGEEKTIKDAKDAQVFVSFNFDEAAQLTDLKDKDITINEYDKQVQEAVVSLMLAGNTIITDSMIYKTLTQSNGRNTPPKWQEIIKKIMHKLNSVYINANLEQLASCYSAFREFDELKIRTRLLNFSEVYIKTKNGNEVTAYRMFEEPILYRIANIKKQVGSIPIKALENEKLKSTPENTVLKNYLLKRIDQMKKGNLSNFILFETIYEKTNRQTKEEQRTIRANTDMMLLQFKADKLIKDYAIVNEGRKPVKINIML